MLLANFFRIVFRIPFFRKRYYAFYIKIFRPLGLFRNQTTIQSYDKNLKIRLHIDEWIQQQIYFLNVFDQRGIRFVKNNFKPGGVFIDIGANIGCYTLVASKIAGNQGKVYAFEAIAEVYQNLAFNIGLNHLENVVAENKAIYEKSDVLEFHVAHQENMGMSSMFHHDTEGGKTEQVQAVSLDEYVSQIGITQIDFIKIDIEGAEMYALRGMKESLQKYKPIVMVEISEDVLPNTAFQMGDIASILNELNYTQKALDNKGETLEMDKDHTENYHNYVFIPEKG